MSRIRIYNFGPVRDGYIENGGWMDLRKLTVLIGNQGSGKSTVAKLISTLSWIEKDLYRSNGNTERYRKQERALRKMLEYHRIDKYLKSNTMFEYEGDAYHFKYCPGKNLDVFPVISNTAFLLPKITYFPAERNFLSSVKTSKDPSFKFYSESLQEFKEIFQEAKDQMKDGLKIPIPFGSVSIVYNRLNDVLYVQGEDYKVRLSDASSGYQSTIPMFVVSNYVNNMLSEGQKMNETQSDEFNKGVDLIMGTQSLTDQQKRKALTQLASRFNVQRTFNIIEEPEQNLFPSSQRGMLNQLLAFNNSAQGNQLLITTHSPYLIGYISLAIKAHTLYRKDYAPDVFSQIESIVPKVSAISANDVVIYQLDDKGAIRKLEDYKGIPVSSNYLNQELADRNESFAQLLELEDLCQ